MKTSSFLTHVAVAIIVTATFLTIYLIIQQTYRSCTDDAQLQFARDSESKISCDKPCDQLLRMIQ